MGALPEYEMTGRIHLGETAAARSCFSRPKRVYVRTDTQRVELVYGDRTLVCERTEGGDRRGAERRPLTVYKLRSRDDAPDIVALMRYHGPIEVRCQPLTAGRKAIGSALVYHGRLDAVTPNPYDANTSKSSYWSVTLKNWSITASK